MQRHIPGATRALALATLALTPLAHATEVAPYFETWAYGGGYTPTTLMQAKSSGVLAATMAFGVSGGGCTLGGGLEANTSGAGKTDIVNFQAAGGRVILSFGGASGTYLENACSDDAMFNLIKSTLDTTGARAIDFDVEGDQLDIASLNTRRSNVAKRLQAAYPGLYVSFTLPVDPSGLEDDALAVLKSAHSVGVSVNVVNVMAMDYGDASTTMGARAISAATGTFNQIKAIFTGKTDAQLWAMVGVTPMIGVNDTTSEVFPPGRRDAAHHVRAAEGPRPAVVLGAAARHAWRQRLQRLQPRQHQGLRVLQDHGRGQGHAAGRAGGRHVHDHVGVQREVRRHRGGVHGQLGAGAAVPVQRHGARRSSRSRTRARAGIA